MVVVSRRSCHPGAVNFSLRIDRVAAGGDGIGSAPDGRITFVPGALPGDEVEVEVVAAKRSFYRGELQRVVVAADGRTEPPCPEVARGCGGCDWQHAAVELQRDLRVEIVRDALRRIGSIEDADVRPARSLPPLAYRTTVRCAVSEGRAGYRRRRSHDVLVPETCLIAHPTIASIMAAADFGDVGEVTIRVGARTGEVLVHLHADRGEGLSLPPAVIVSTESAPRHLHEIVAGHRYRISGPSFFQCRPDGAELMIELVAEALGDNTSGRLVDAYAGVGLFGAALGEHRPLTAIEVAPSSVGDARHNLPDHAEIVESTVERWSPVPAAAVVADPARAGLGSEGVAVLAATGAATIVLVSCDPAALGRDAGLLVAAGYELDWVQTVDLFGHSSHIEAVSRFTRPSGVRS